MTKIFKRTTNDTAAEHLKQIILSSLLLRQGSQPLVARKLARACILEKSRRRRDRRTCRREIAEESPTAVMGRARGGRHRGPFNLRGAAAGAPRSKETRQGLVSILRL